MNVAKPALQLQATEAPKFDDIFIMFGAFHIQMAFFKTIGKLVAESGGPRMLTECQVLATGSLKSFVAGTFFNRHKHRHSILALAMQILHFREFPKTSNNGEAIKALVSSQCMKEGQYFDWIDITVFQDLIRDYEKFSNQTRNGAHGPTSRFWLMYVDYMNHYRMMDRAIQQNDMILFTEALAPIIELFFAMDHPNYARWMTKYQLNLLNTDETHPGLRDILEAGGLAVRRTDHSFSRCPVDLMLEQTGDADAATRQTGIIHATNNFGARYRWSATKSTRARIVSQMLEMAGMSNATDVEAELWPARIERDRTDLQNIIKKIEESCNPFSAIMNNESLCNTQTGRQASKTVEENLLNVPSLGRLQRLHFIEECIQDPDRFEKPIKRNRLLTCESECVQNRRTPNRKVADLKCTRDLMGHLLILAMSEEVDLGHVLSFPLILVPLSLCHNDGIMTKTDKSKLLHVLEKRVSQSSPGGVDACVIDGNFLLHTIPPNLPKTFASIARVMLVSNCKKRIDVVFETYRQPLIKDAERSRRETEKCDFVITGSKQL